ncbi:hypothetical protein RUND412_011062 [Rhizina undulata]
MDIPAFATTQLELLKLEQEAEITQQTALITSLPPSSLQRHGLALLNLTPTAQRTGLGGRTMLELEPDAALNPDEKLPAHGIRSGDIVRIEEQPSGSAKKKEKAELKEKGVEGVVHRVLEGKIVVAVDSGRNDDSSVDALLSSAKRLWVVKMANNVVFKRMERVMGILKDSGERGGGDQVMRVLFGLSKPSSLRPGWEKTEVRWYDEGLNESQKEAVRFALESKEVALIHGPPGTGKTQTLLEIIRQLTTPPPPTSASVPETKPKRILVCGPSNISVDNIILRLPPSLPIVRLGHPARLLPKVVERSLDVLTTTSEQGEIVKDVRGELDSMLGKLLGGGKGRLKGRERKEGWREVGDLRNEFRRREEKCVRDLVGNSKVVLSTLHGAGGRQLRGEQFDVLIIDEASQALEAQCWIPLLMNKGIEKVILAGDHLQLPPTVKSIDPKSKSTKSKKTKEKAPPSPSTVAPTKNGEFSIPESLEVTLFSRLLEIHGSGIKRLLNTQYRMHQDIMHFPSKELYEDKLVAAESVKTHLLKDLPGVSETPDTSVPIVFIDTQGGDFPESDPEESAKSSLSESKANPLEAKLAANYVRDLIAAGVKPSDIAVITPYNGQLALLQAELREEFPELEMGSVDGFQGREKEVVVLSLVRSNDKREVGFLKEKRRLNVAITRCRRQLCVVGDSDTVGAGGKGKFLGNWMKWVEEKADVRYPDVSEVLMW